MSVNLEENNNLKSKNNHDDGDGDEDDDDNDDGRLSCSHESSSNMSHKIRNQINRKKNKSNDQKLNNNKSSNLNAISFFFSMKSRLEKKKIFKSKKTLFHRNSRCFKIFHLL